MANLGVVDVLADFRLQLLLLSLVDLRVQSLVVWLIVERLWNILVLLKQFADAFQALRDLDCVNVVVESPHNVLLESHAVVYLHDQGISVTYLLLFFFLHFKFLNIIFQ